ncbi:hypothetical protein NPIL_94181 [Nephila pilipes]|uniref:Uncharacterized protein n=1 Tax=Nephila pilipes TaxID=299642 RepID=A0A8X6P2Q6_NEPPI|nr:hypothetical protein NPIL_94181 [Nephila pilipes]
MPRRSPCSACLIKNKTTTLAESSSMSARRFARTHLVLCPRCAFVSPPPHMETTRVHHKYPHHQVHRHVPFIKRQRGHHPEPPLISSGHRSSLWARRAHRRFHPVSMGSCPPVPTRRSYCSSDKSRQHIMSPYHRPPPRFNKRHR